MRQRAERAMCRRMAVTANDRHARQGPALFGADDVHDPLTDIRHGVVVHAEILGVLVERLDLNAAFFVVDAFFTVQRGGHVVIRHGDGLFRCADFAASHAQPLKGLRRRHLVHKVAVDIQKAGAVGVFLHDMGIPDLVIERLGGHVSSPVYWRWSWNTEKERRARL
jgi:hypothetical protein